MDKISVIIHTYNNESILRRCLESVKCFDEIVLCDMYSTDNTLEIAKEYNCKIVMHEKLDIVEPARNYAISQASNDWVLIVDSDEVITKELREYLYKFIKETQYNAIKIPRINIFWGVAMETHYPDYVCRFAKKTAIFWPKEIHAQPHIEGETYQIPPTNRELAFVHYTCNSPKDMVNTINKYTDYELEKLINSDKKSINMYFAIWKSFILIFEKFLLKKGYKNGIEGLIICIFFGFYKFLTYTKYHAYLKKNHVSGKIEREMSEWRNW